MRFTTRMSKTRIIEAVQNLDLETTKKLLEAKPSLLTVKNRQGRNLLHLACGASCSKLKVPESRAARMVNFLLDRGMDIEEEGLSGRDPCKPIWFAVCFGRNLTVVKLLIKRGATPTGLYAAGWWQDIKILDALIKAGTPIEVVAGVTPFLACWCWRRFEAAKFLATKGANVNYQDPRNGKTALHYGVEREFEPALLRWLVAHGASPDIEDNDGITARVRALHKRNKSYAEALA
jgi:ankyrin repeat protein